MVLAEQYHSGTNNSMLAHTTPREGSNCLSEIYVQPPPHTHQRLGPTSFAHVSHQQLAQSDSSESSHLPSLQVTHPTPTKGRKFKRTDTEVSTSSEGMYVDSLNWQTPLLPTPAPGSCGSLEVTVEPLGACANRKTRLRSSENTADTKKEKSESERQTELLAEKQARTREKGRERQRRKRERDRKAKEVSFSGVLIRDLLYAKVAAVLKSRNAPTHLSSNPSINALSITVPSPASTYSSLATGSYMSISPTHPLALSTGSTSMSGESSPNTNFSPAVSTPATALSLEGLKSNYWNEGLIIRPDLSNKPIRPIRVTRASSGSIPSLKKGLNISVATSLPVRSTSDSKLESTPPFKRRKSEPESEPSRIVNESSVSSESNSKGQKMDRSRPTRTKSDGFILIDDASKARSKSSTPPMSILPEEYQRQIESARPASQPETVSSAPSASTDAYYFALTVILSMNRNEDQEVKLMKERLGLSGAEMQSMKDGLAAFYDQWAIEKSISKTSVDLGTVNATLTHQDNSASTPYSPPCNCGTFQKSFFTPSSSTATHYDTRSPSTMPMTFSFVRQAGESPLAAQSHGRQRSLSAISVTNRANMLRWQPETPTESGPSGLINTKDENGSPITSIIHTPSAGQSTFPMLESMGPFRTHWRSITDPTGDRTCSALNQTQRGMPNESWANNNLGELDSPLSVIGQLDRSEMMPPPSSAPHQGGIQLITNLGPTTEQPPIRDSRLLSQSRVFTSHHLRTSSGPGSAGFENTQRMPFAPTTPLNSEGPSQTDLESGGEYMQGSLYYHRMFGTLPPSVADGQKGHSQMSIQAPMSMQGHEAHHQQTPMQYTLGFQLKPSQPQLLQPCFGQSDNQ
nr:hypothetical protein L204_02664 [Cryptococcus depauperatus CBS 7855]